MNILDFYYYLMPTMIISLLIIFVGMYVWLQYSKRRKKISIENCKKYTLEACLKDTRNYTESKSL